MRRERAHDRALVHLAKANFRLGRHHGSAPEPRLPMGASYKDVLQGKTTPHWGCGCGYAENWASRIRCLKCQKEAPANLRKRAQQADQEAKSAKEKLGKEGGKQIGELLKRIAKLEKELKESNSSKGSESGESVAMDTGGLPDQHAWDADIARKEAQLEAIGEDPSCPKDAERREQLLREVAELKANARGAKPIGAQVLAAQRLLKVLDTKLVSKKGAIQQIEQEQKELEQRLHKAKAEQEQLTTKRSEVAAELEVLVAKSVGKEPSKESVKAPALSLESVPELMAQLQGWGVNMSTDPNLPEDIKGDLPALAKVLKDAEESWQKISQAHKKYMERASAAVAQAAAVPVPGAGADVGAEQSQQQQPSPEWAQSLARSVSQLFDDEDVGPSAGDAADEAAAKRRKKEQQIEQMVAEEVARRSRG